MLTLFVFWESRRVRQHKGALVDPTMLRVPGLQAGLTSFFFQFLLQAGLFFVIPLFLSVALGLSAVATGVRLLPLSIALLAAAVGVPKIFPKASPRRVVRIGFGLLFVAIVILVAVARRGLGSEVVTWPLILAGLGVGALASQLGQRHRVLAPRLAERRGRRRPEHPHEPGRIHRHGPGRHHPDRRPHLDVPRHSWPATPRSPPPWHRRRRWNSRRGSRSSATRTSLRRWPRPDVPTETADAIVSDNASARINGLRASLAVLALLALVGLALTRRLPTVQPSERPPLAAAGAGPPTDEAEAA